VVAATLAPAPAANRGAAASWDKLLGTMLILSMSQALGTTLALLATFLGIGVIVNVLILYIVGQVFAEHKQNQEAEPGAE
jgi:hypothetical protein